MVFSEKTDGLRGQFRRLSKPLYGKECFSTLLDLANYAIMTVLEMDAPDESHATMYAYDKPFYTVGEDK